MARQLTRVSTPPSTGPHAEATEPPIAHTATARARLTESGYACPISAIDDGMITAAAAPCTILAAISAPIAGASPHAADTRANSPTPAPNARRAPARSESAPADSSSAANSSVQPSTTHCSPVIPPPRSARIEGKATLTTTASSVTTKNPSTAAASAATAWRDRRGGVINGAGRPRVVITVSPAGVAAATAPVADASQRHVHDIRDRRPQGGPADRGTGRATLPLQR